MNPYESPQTVDTRAHGQLRKWACLWLVISSLSLCVAILTAAATGGAVASILVTPVLYVLGVNPPAAWFMGMFTLWVLAGVNAIFLVVLGMFEGHCHDKVFELECANLEPRA